MVWKECPARSHVMQNLSSLSPLLLMLSQPSFRMALSCFVLSLTTFTFKSPIFILSHGAVCSLAWLATGRKMHPCSLSHCCWLVHSTGWWWCWCASPSFWSSSTCCWLASIPSGTSPFLSSGWCNSLVVLVIISTTVSNCLSCAGSIPAWSCPSALANSKKVQIVASHLSCNLCQLSCVIHHPHLSCFWHSRLPSSC